MKMGGRTTRATDMSGRPAPDLTAKPEDVYIPESHWYGDKEIHPVRVHVSPTAVPLNRGDLNLDGVEQDLAILEFATDMSTAKRSVAENPPNEGEPVHIVGYGHHWGADRTPPTVGRYIGQNKLSVSIDGAHVVKGAAASCSDSGGPLVNSRTGQIIGVTSTSVNFGKDSVLGKKTDKLSIFTDITSGEGAKFVQGVVDDFKARHR